MTTKESASAELPDDDEAMPTQADILKTWPDRIWLQGNDTRETEVYVGSSDISWCAESIFGGDVEYLRADLAQLVARPAVDAGPEWGIAEVQTAAYKDDQKARNQRARSLLEAMAAAPAVQAVSNIPLLEQLESLLSEFGNNSFDAGEWDEDSDPPPTEQLEAIVARNKVCRSNIIELFRAALASTRAQQEKP